MQQESLIYDADDLFSEIKNVKITYRNGNDVITKIEKKDKLQHLVRTCLLVANVYLHIA